MSTGYQIKDQQALYYLTLQIVDWIDIFTRQNYRDIFLDSLRFCQQNKGLQVFGYVIMSNHVHLIVNSPDGELSAIIRDLKKFTSRSIIDSITNGNESRKEWILNQFKFNAIKHSKQSIHQMWTHENHAIHLFTPKFTWEKLEYIHKNPVRAGIVEKPEEYLYSSARNYADTEALLDVILLDRPFITY